VFVLLLLAATRLAVLFLAVNGQDDVPSQVLADAVAAAVVLYVAFGGDRVAKWVGVLLFAVWGLASLAVAIRLGASITFSLRGEVVLLLAVGGWGVAVQALAVLTGGACVGFAGVLAGSRSVNRYSTHRRGPRAAS